MLSLQELTQNDQVQPQLRAVERSLDRYGSFHPSRASVLHVDDYALRLQIQETLQTIPLQEFLAKSGTTGIAGAAYLVPDALHLHLMAASKVSDKVPLFAAEVVSNWKGGDLKVDIPVRQAEGTVTKWTLQPTVFTSGGKMRTQTVETTQATVNPKGFSVAPRITEDLVEDSNFALIEWHLNHAAQQIGQYATDLAIADLKAAADGTGTQCAVAAGSDVTTADHIAQACGEVGAEFWDPDTLITSTEAWYDTISSSYGVEVAGGAAGDYWSFYLPPTVQYPAMQTGYDAKWATLDVALTNSKNLHAAVTSGRMTNCISLVLDRSAALLCGRKRWLQLEEYAEPTRDLAGMVLSCRQDCVTLYKDASCEITET